jgi:hypothetical protein
VGHEERYWSGYIESSKDSGCAQAAERLTTEAASTTIASGSSRWVGCFLRGIRDFEVHDLRAGESARAQHSRRPTWLAHGLGLGADFALVRVGPRAPLAVFVVRIVLAVFCRWEHVA